VGWGGGWLGGLAGPAAPWGGAEAPHARRSTLKNLLLQPRYDALISELATLAAPNNHLNPFNPRNNRSVLSLFFRS
jgi:hypothetical protein